MPNYLKTGLLQHWKNHYSQGEKTFQMCTARAEKMLSAERNT